MERIGEYLAMGGYAAYVWPALAIAAGMLLFLAVWSMMQLRSSQHRLDQLEPIAERRREERRARREHAGGVASGGAASGAGETDRTVEAVSETANETEA